MGGRLEAQTGVDDVALEDIGGRHLQGSGCNDCVELGRAHALLIGGDFLERFEHRGGVLVGEAVAQTLDILHDGVLVVACSEHDSLDRFGNGAGELGRLGAVLAAQARDLVHGALELGHADVALGVQSVGLCREDPRHIVERDDAHGVGRRLDQGGACHDARNGAGVCHVEIVAARNAQLDFSKLGSGLEEVADELGELFGQHGARGVAHDHRLGAGAGNGLDDLRQIGNIGAGGVDGHELDVVGERGALGNGTGGVVDERVGLLALDVFHA